MRCIGIDLAWGRRATTAAACIKSDDSGHWTLSAIEWSLGPDSAIIDFILNNDGDNGCLVAIDAPTQVPNTTGQRPCEAECRRLYSRYQAGPHPANRTLYKGDIRGENLVDMLEPHGYRHDPTPPRACVYRIMEVFPHPAHVALFDLERILKYKAKPGRTIAARLAEFERYVNYLQGLRHASPPLVVADAILHLPTRTTIAALKTYEDGLDAITCAYVAAYYLHWGAERVTVLGDMDTGHIVVPRILHKETTTI